MLAPQWVENNDGVVGYAARVANGNYSHFGYLFAKMRNSDISKC